MGIHALAFWKSTVSLVNASLLKESATIGEHLKLRRKRLGLLQEDVAKLLGVSDDTITNWENDKVFPKISYYPVINMFLGYDFFKGENRTFGEKIAALRIKEGMSYKKMGKLFGVNPSTIASWEREEFLPRKVNRNKIQKLF